MSRSEWTYGAPDDWGELHEAFAECDLGARQTPIDLRQADAMPTGTPIAFWGYDAAIPLVLENNGHTLQVDYKGTRAATDPHVTYKGKEYYLLQLHFHSPSEHTIDGEHALMEVHFVHEAEDGAKAVVGVLIREGDENAEFAKVLENRPAVGKAMEVCSAELSLNAFLPESRTSFHYLGSLTTPPCSEGLQWWVMKEPVTVKASQREDYASLFPEETNRPLQELHGRVVEVYEAPQ